MSPGPLTPIILQAERQRGGELHVQLRLSDGRTGWAILPAGELGEQLLGELDPELLARFAPPPPISDNLA